jgi:hypothetical protein
MNSNTNYSHQKYDFKLYNKKTFDFQLIDYDGYDGVDESELTSHLIMDLDFITRTGEDLLFNKVNWVNEKTTTEPIPTYGLTGVDNGAIPYVDETSLTDSTLVLPERLELLPVTGYTHLVDDVEPINYETHRGYNDVVTFKGGFYQGFYKLDGYDFQMLPNRYKHGWTIQTNLTPDSTIPQTNTLNTLGTDTEGFFFYLGTRAENKFWNTFEGLDPENNTLNETTYSGVTEEDFIIPLNPPRIVVKRESNQFLIYGRADGNTMCGRKSNGFGFGTKTPGQLPSGQDLVYKTYIPLEEGDEINPFLKYGRSIGKTMCGSEKDNNYGEAVAGNDPSPFNLSDTLDKYKDIINNAIGFRLKYNEELEGYNIGYRRIEEPDCDSELDYVIKEEYSSYVIPDGSQSNITLKWVADSELECEYDEPRLGKLYLYVNGFLKHVFNDFKEIINRPLYEHVGKQVGVPFNISVGGGTQGLKESMTFNGPDPDDKNLPLETYFAGTFIGEMEGFKMYDKPLTWCEIKNNLN